MERNIFRYGNISLWIAMFIYFIMDFLSIYISEGVSVRMFDLQMFAGYDFQYATTFLNEISEKGRNIYLFVQLPLDFIFPFLIASFFSLFFYGRTKRKELIFLGFAPMLFDYIENIFIIIMLTTSSLTPSIVNVASTATIIKAVLYAVNITLTIILYFIYRKKGDLLKETQPEET